MLFGGGALPDSQKSLITLLGALAATKDKAMAVQKYIRIKEGEKRHKKEGTKKQNGKEKENGESCAPIKIFKSQPLWEGSREKFAHWKV